MYVTAQDIENCFDNTKDHIFPELIKRLVACTIPTTFLVKNDFLYDFKINNKGDDGVVINSSKTNNNYVPQGTSYWEVSVQKSDITNKANKDYKKSLSDHENDAGNCSFVFVTSRIWKGKNSKKKWLSHEKRKKWKEIKAYDAEDLAKWLNEESSKPVKFWFQILSSKRSYGLKTIDELWNEWARQSDPEITMDAFLHGREAEKNDLNIHLSKDDELKILDENSNIKTNDSGKTKYISIKAETDLEACAFATAVILEHSDQNLKNRTVVIYDHQGWQRVHSNSHDIHVVIVTKSELAQSTSGFDKIVIVPSTKNSKSDEKCITLNNYDFEKALEKILLKGSHQEASRKVGNSWSVFRRIYSINPATRNPEWTKNKDYSYLSGLCLIESWDQSNEHDKNLVRSVIGKKYDDIEGDLLFLQNLEDNPFYRNDKKWSIKSLYDFTYLMGKYLKESSINIFFQTDFFKENFDSLTKRYSQTILDSHFDVICLLNPLDKNQVSLSYSIDEFKDKIEKQIKNLLPDRIKKIDYRYSPYCFEQTLGLANLFKDISDKDRQPIVNALREKISFYKRDDHKKYSYYENLDFPSIIEKMKNVINNLESEDPLYKYDHLFYGSFERNIENYPKENDDVANCKNAIKEIIEKQHISGIKRFLIENNSVSETIVAYVLSLCLRDEIISLDDDSFFETFLINIENFNNNKIKSFLMMFFVYIDDFKIDYIKNIIYIAEKNKKDNKWFENFASVLPAFEKVWNFFTSIKKENIFWKNCTINACKNSEWIKVAEKLIKYERPITAFNRFYGYSNKFQPRYKFSLMHPNINNEPNPPIASHTNKDIEIWDKIIKEAVKSKEFDTLDSNKISHFINEIESLKWLGEGFSQGDKEKIREWELLLIPYTKHFFRFGKPTILYDSIIEDYEFFNRVINNHKEIFNKIKSDFTNYIYESTTKNTISLENVVKNYQDNLITDSLNYFYEILGSVLHLLAKKDLEENYEFLIKLFEDQKSMQNGFSPYLK